MIKNIVNKAKKFYKRIETRFSVGKQRVFFVAVMQKCRMQKFFPFKKIIFKEKEAFFLKRVLPLAMVPVLLVAAASPYVYDTYLRPQPELALKNRAGESVKYTAHVSQNNDQKYQLNVKTQNVTLSLDEVTNNPKDIPIVIDKAPAEEKRIMTDVVFVDDSVTPLNFKQAQIQLTQTGDKAINAILTCPTWDFDKEKGTCGNWQISDIKPQKNGKTVAFAVDHFSAYAGAYLEIINHQTNLTVGDIWELRFTTYGTRDLQIQTVNGTVYGTDVKFIDFYCGETKLDHDTVFDGTKVFIPNYSCDGEQSRLVDRSATPGPHYLEVKYGDQTDTAHNFACNVGTLDTTCEVSSSNTMTNGSVISGAGNLVIKSGGILTTSAGQSFSINMTGNVTIQNGGTITGNLSNLQAANLTLEATGSIDLSSKGYGVAGGPSPGTAPLSGSYSTPGAGHGGSGGSGYGFSNTANRGAIYSGGAAYDSIIAPVDYGSGARSNSSSGGLAGLGGGAVRITITGTLSNLGSINVGGQDAPSTAVGGGAGGSIYVTAATIAGDGSFLARGGMAGNAGGGSGGGGRIALYYTTYTFSGTTSYRGGTINATTVKGRIGGSGTLYRKSATATNGDLYIDNGSTDPLTDLPTSSDDLYGKTEVSGTLTFDTITVSNKGVLVLTSSSNITYTTLNWSSSGVIIYNGGTFALVANNTSLTIPSGATLHINTPRTFSNVTVGGTLTHSSNYTTQTNVLDITVTGNMTISSGGVVDVAGKGFFGAAIIGGTGFGSGGGGGVTSVVTGGASGAGYGGAGGLGNASGVGPAGGTYGSSVFPASLGSGGGGGGNLSNGPGLAGGGSVTLNITGALAVNGVIKADGRDGPSTAVGGGGSGGSVYIATGTISGASNITAKGANTGASSGGGGGGGRIAIYASSSTYLGSITAALGTGLNNGVAGTTNIDLTSPLVTFTDFCTELLNACTAGGANQSPQRPYQVRKISADITSSAQMNGVTISIKDTDSSVNKWYNPTTHLFDQTSEYLFVPTITESFPVTDGAVSFSYDTTAVPWQISHLYQISVDTEKVTRTAISTTSFYFDNSPPTVTNLTASQDSTGTITANFDVTDAESASTTTSLFTDLGSALSAPAATNSASLSVNNTTYLSASGSVLIDGEEISYSGKTATTLTGLTRAIHNTMALSHLSAATVWVPAAQATGNVGTVTNGTGKTISWTPKDEYSGYYSATGRILVLANDGQASSMVSTATSATFVLDAKAPTLSSVFIVDASATSPLFTLPCTDDTALEMRIGLVSNLSDATWRTFAGSISASSLGLSVGDPMTVYAQCRDSKGNLTSIQTVSSPQTPSNIFYQDISNISTSDWREFIAWSAVTAPSPGFKRYLVYRSVDGGAYSLLTTITDRLVNYTIDLGLDPTKLYTYKIVTEDLNNNLSYFSTPISDTPDGTGGTDITPATISGVASSNVTTTQATITWATSKLSDSKVYYKPTTIYPGTNKASYTSSQGVPSMVTSNSVTLSGLTPNTQYFYLVESTDAFDNNGSSASALYTFTTDAGPVISQVSATQIFDTEATVVWKTNVPADSTIAYSTNSDLSDPTTFAGSGDMVENHSVTLTGLTGGTKYYYQVRSTDESANEAIDNNVEDGTILYYSFVTTLDTGVPVLSNIGSILTGERGVTIGWQTDELTTSQLLWGTTAALGQQTTPTNVYTIQHAVTLTSLEPSTTYYYKVVSVDKSGNTTTSSPAASVTTAAITVIEKDPNPPVFSNVDVTDITGTTAKVTWLTDKTSDSFVNFGTTNTTFDTTLGKTETVATHSVELKDLKANTTYYFKVTGRDTDGNLGTSAIFSFTTSSLLTETESATENADNAELVSTVVDIIKDASKAFVEKIMSALASNPNLASLPEDSVVSLISTLSDKALSAPTIDSTNVTIEPQAESAVIKWETNKPSNSMVAYATQDEYKSGAEEPYTVEIGDSQNLVTIHEVELQGLTPNTTYHMQTRSKDSFGPVAFSADSTFTTEALTAEITDVNISTDNVSTVKISWKTSIPTRQQVSVQEIESGEKFAFANQSYVRDHSFEADILSPGLNYVALLTVVDETGTSKSSSPIPFAALNDSMPPRISEAKVITSLIPGKVEKVQSILSWRTDKQSSSQIVFQPGGGSIPADTKNIITEKALTRDHLIVTSAFLPGQIYRYRIESTDFAGTTAVSQDYTLLSPKPKESVVNLIVNNVQDMFGFLRVN